MLKLIPTLFYLKYHIILSKKNLNIIWKNVLLILTLLFLLILCPHFYLHVPMGKWWKPGTGIWECTWVCCVELWRTEFTPFWSSCVLYDCYDSFFNIDLVIYFSSISMHFELFGFHNPSSFFLHYYMHDSDFTTLIYKLVFFFFMHAISCPFYFLRTSFFF